MVNLHKIIEALNGRYLMVADEFDDESLISGAIYEAKIKCTNAQCFLVGNWEEFQSIRLIEDLLILPYDTTFFEMILMGTTLGVLCDKADNGFNYWIFQKEKEAFRLADFGSFKKEDAITITMELAGRKKSETIRENNKNSTMTALGLIGKYLSILNCKGVSSKMIDAPTKLNKKRIKSKKPPIYSYWVLTIDKDESETLEAGGSHRSPRIHLRRRHQREYAPGKFTLVSPCVVGKGPGIVVKDYALSI